MRETVNQIRINPRMSRKPRMYIRMARIHPGMYLKIARMCLRNARMATIS